MSEQNVHYQTLGLTETSSFEEVQAARERLVAQHEADPQQKQSIEAAYDAILMEKLRLRQEGKIKVPDRIRFAEKQAKVKATPTPISNLSDSSSQWFSTLLDQPADRSELLWPSVIFSVLAALSWVFVPQGSDVFPSPAHSEANTTAAVVLALGVMTTVYLLNQKNRKLWRSLGLSAIGLVLGLSLGLLIETIFQSQGQAFSPAYTSSLLASITLAVLWFITGFIR